MYAQSLAIAATLLASTGLSAPTKGAESAPFALVANSRVSHDDGSKTYDHAAITACHSGAAIEALCVYGSGGQTFTFNATDEAPIQPNQSNPGYLIFTLPSEPKPYPQQLSFYKNETSNVNAGFFGGSTSGPAKLIIDHDTQSLAVVTPSGPVALAYSWYVCPQTYAPYHFNTVSYVPIGEIPDNTACEAISLDLA